MRYHRKGGKRKEVRRISPYIKDYADKSKKLLLYMMGNLVKHYMQFDSSSPVNICQKATLIGANYLKRLYLIKRRISVLSSCIRKVSFPTPDVSTTIAENVCPNSYSLFSRHV